MLNKQFFGRSEKVYQKNFAKKFETLKHYPCPNCKETANRFGALSLLTKDEVEKLKIKEGKDNYPDKIWGCDECKFWCDDKYLKTVLN